ncbi:MAG: phosphate acyltransferase PlsX [Thermoanaerobaculia bacterium]
MRIAVDAMGGDFAPAAVVAGAVDAARELGAHLLLVGDREAVERELAGVNPMPPRLEVVHADEVVGMDDPATAPIRRKRRSSVRICAELVRDGQAEAMVTAGNTGAAMVAAKVVAGTIEGVDRPALAAVLPNAGGHTVLLDVGANVDSRPRHLREFAVMGHFYAQEVLGMSHPRVGLLSIGEEEVKGSDLTRQVYQVMETTGLHFIGNVEGGDIFNGKADVVVCDGFVGNAVLKSAESIAELVGSMLRTELEHSLRARLGAVLAAPALKRLRRRTDYSEYGGAALLGINGGCFIGHGRSNPRAVHSMIRRAAEFCEADLHNQIRRKVADLHAEEARLLGAAEAPEVSAG